MNHDKNVQARDFFNTLLKLASSHEFGAFANRTFDSVAEAKAWVTDNVPDQELDLIKVWIDGRVLSGRELKNVTGD